MGEPELHSNDDTVGKIIAQRRTEYIVSGSVLGAVALISLLAALSIPFGIEPGRLTSSPLFDRFISLFLLVAGVLFGYGAYTCLNRYLCRFCQTDLKPTQFRCAKCGHHVMEKFKSEHLEN